MKKNGQKKQWVRKRRGRTLRQLGLFFFALGWTGLVMGAVLMVLRFTLNRPRLGVFGLLYVGGAAVFLLLHQLLRWRERSRRRKVRVRND